MRTWPLTRSVGQIGSAVTTRMAVVVLLVAALLPAAGAHPANLTAALFKVEPEGRFQIGLDFDALAFVIDDVPARIPESAIDKTLRALAADRTAMVEDAADRLRDGTVLEVDGKPARFGAVTLPPASRIFQASRVHGTHVPLLLEADLSGTVPPGLHRFRIRFPEVIGTVVVTFDLPGIEPTAQPAAPGEFTAAIAASTPGGSSAPPQEGPSAWLMSWGRFVVLGFQHILPDGLDHILFVFGLFLLSSSFRMLLGQVTAFTLAHSITLGLSLYGVCRLPPRIVEPLIAFSIVLIAIDNLRATKATWRRYVLVFGFGLVHGLGFAGALLDLGLTRSELAPALAGFNVGIELGQLTVIAIAFAAVGWWRNRPQYRKMIVIPLSVAICLVALIWTVQRVLRTPQATVSIDKKSVTQSAALS